MIDSLSLSLCLSLSLSLSLSPSLSLSLSLRFEDSRATPAFLDHVMMEQESSALPQTGPSSLAHTDSLKLIHSAGKHV
jgi:hypothetical protein